MFPAFFLSLGSPMKGRKEVYEDLLLAWMGPAPRLKFFMLMDNFYRDVVFVMSDVKGCRNSHNRWYLQETRVSLELATAHLKSIGNKVR